MVKYAGAAFISRIGASKFTIVLCNYHRGCLKYDPELAQNRYRLQLAADAAHQARVSAYYKHIMEYGYPDDLPSFGRLYDAGEDAVPESVQADIDTWRRRVQEHESVILSLRTSRETGGGSSTGMDSEQAKAVAAATNAGSELAQGRKTIKGVVDPARVSQFERLLAEQKDKTARHHPDSHHPCRPDGYSLEARKAWHMSLDEGQQVLTSARRKGKGSEKDGMALAQWRAANPGKEWQNAVSPAVAILTVAV